MLFKKKRCEKCGHMYDEALSECPKCHQTDGNFRKLGIPKEISWIAPWQQIVLFLSGFAYLGFLLYQLIYAYLLKDFFTDNIEFSFAVNSFLYLTIFVVAVLVLIPTVSVFIKDFKKWDKYLYGIAWATTLFAVSNIMGAISQFGLGAVTNTNQSGVILLFKSHPLEALLIMGVLGPICEELTYRVGLYSFLRRINKYVAIIVTTVVFAFIHLEFGQGVDMVNELKSLPSYLSAGLIFCLAYEHKGAPASMTTHILYNTTALLISLGQ